MGVIFICLFAFFNIEERALQSKAECGDECVLETETRQGEKKIRIEDLKWPFTAHSNHDRKAFNPRSNNYIFIYIYI